MVRKFSIYIQSETKSGTGVDPLEDRALNLMVDDKLTVEELDKSLTKFGNIFRRSLGAHS
jgi:hypothetical protein